MSSEIKILVVDDSKVQRLAVMRAIENIGYKADGACNGEEGLERVNQEHYLFVISDIHMPKMNGFQFVAALREKSDSPPVFIISADVQEETKNQMKDLGVYGFINKPIKQEIMAEIIDKMIEKAG